jgi:hypothetical protein
MAATVHPPTISTGAAAEETTPHQGTARTITTVVAVAAQLQQPGLRRGRRTPPPWTAFAAAPARGSGSVFTFDHKEGTADHAGQL